MSIMPLTEAQKRFIDGALSHFFDDLPTEDPACFETVSSIKKAFNLELNADDCFIDLQNCFTKPTQYFQRLEKYNADILIGEVREYILSIATQQLKKIFPIPWDTQLFQEQFNDSLAPFISLKLRTEDNNEFAPWAFPETDDQMFKMEMIVVNFDDPDSSHPINHIKLRLHIKLNPPLIREFFLVEFPLGTTEFEQSIEFMQQIKPKALLAGKQVAAYAIIQHLNTLSSPSTIFNLEDNENLSSLIPEGMLIVLDKFYFNMIRTGKLQLNDFKNITADQVETLEDSVAKNLITQGHNIYDVANLTLAEKNIVQHHFYSQKILRHEIKIHEIKGVKLQESIRLILPAVTHLLAAEKIAFVDAKMLTAYSTEIIANEFYFNYCMSLDKSTLTSLILLFNSLSVEGKNALITPGIINLISAGILTIEDACHISTSQIDTFCLPRINQLLLNNAITIDECNALTPEAIFILVHNPFITEQLPNPFHSAPLIIWANMLAHRLQKIYQGTPLIINDVADNIVLLHKDIEEIMERENLIKNQLLNFAFKIFLTQLKYELEDKPLLPPYHKIYAEIRRTTTTENEQPLLNNPYNQWGAAFFEITQQSVKYQANDNRCKKYCGALFRFFSDENSTKASTFHRRIAAMATLVSAEEYGEAKKTSSCFRH
jgi:hypothetical protein